MPLNWKADLNPYEFSYFAILGLGANATRQQIVIRRQNIESAIKIGIPHVVHGREISLAQVAEAAGRLLEEKTWAEELLLTHPSPGDDPSRIVAITRRIAAATTEERPVLKFTLMNIRAFGLPLPPPVADDIPLPPIDDVAGLDPEFGRRLSRQVEFDS